MTTDLTDALESVSDDDLFDQPLLRYAVDDAVLEFEDGSRVDLNALAHPFSEEISVRAVSARSNVEAIEATMAARQRIGRWIASRRDSAGLTQQQVAARTGLPLELVAELERGDAGTSLATISAVVHGIGAKLSQFAASGREQRTTTETAQALWHSAIAHDISSTTSVSVDDARHVARMMSALATPSRVLILGRLRDGPCSVRELATAVEMEPPAISHQLRILRDLGLVRGARNGRHVVYGLYDSHVAQLLTEAIRHIEYLRSGETGSPGPAVRGVGAGDR